jgi:DNA polymerase-3 subunit delta
MIYFLYGSDSFRTRFRLKELIESESQKQAGLKFESVDFSRVDFCRLAEKLASHSLFGEAPAWVLKYVFEAPGAQVKELYEFLIKRAPQVLLLVIFEPSEILVSKLPQPHQKLYQFLAKKARCEKFEFLKGAPLLSWARTYAHSQNWNFEPSALELLVGGASLGTWAVAQEMAKLATFVPDKPVSLKEVKELASLEASPVIFDLLDAIGQQKQDRALYFLEQCFLRPEALIGRKNAAAEGQKQEDQDSLIFYLVAMLAYSLRTLMQVKEFQEQNLSDFEIQKRTRLHPYVIKKAGLQARWFQLENLKVLFSKLVELDQRLKSSPAPKQVLLQRFIAQASSAGSG